MRHGSSVRRCSEVTSRSFLLLISFAAVVKKTQHPAFLSGSVRNFAVGVFDVGSLKAETQRTTAEPPTNITADDNSMQGHARVCAPAGFVASSRSSALTQS